VDNVRRKLPAADIFVLPSRTEGNSNAVLEAMEAGLPIVATTVGGTPMQVGEEGEPLLFNVGDSNTLAERLLLLIQDAGLRRHYGEAMRRRVERHFDILHVAEVYRGAYGCLSRSLRFNMHHCGALPG
jgi:glycosyltransferase involved in cell wall biosynthesis